MDSGYTSAGGTYGGGVLYRLNENLPPFVALVPFQAEVGKPVEILGQGFTASTTVSFNGTTATTVKVSDGRRLVANVPRGATSGYVTVKTSSGTLTSNQPFIVARLACH